MAESWQSVTFSLDLKTAAFNQLHFLKEVNDCPAIHGGPLVLQAINRYERFWLPLAAYHFGEKLAAPLDIEWMWHCHMLAPLKYQKDSRSLVGCIVNHKIMNPSERKLSLSQSEEYWRGIYPEEPFEVELSEEKITPNLQQQSISSYDIAAAVTRQKEFYYQVSLPHYISGNFLQIGVDRYKKFIYLNQFHPEQFLVPCYDIDLIWHSHQLHPLAYIADTEYLLGGTFNHDDDVGDRSVGSKLQISDMETRDLWRAAFSEGFPMFGAMYRGESPVGKLYTMLQCMY